MIQVRMVAVDLEAQPAKLNITTREGVLSLQDVQGFGAALSAGGKAYGLSPASLAVIGKWFLAAAISQGQDV
jgi:hypothetical protein